MKKIKEWLKDKISISDEYVCDFELGGEVISLTSELSMLHGTS